MEITTRMLPVFFLAIWTIGCGTTSVGQGRRYIAEHQYTQAIQALTNALNENPDSPEIHRDLGIAYYGAGQYQQALDELTQAKETLKRDGRLIFYLGLTLEQLEQYDKAIEVYAQYTQLSRFSPMRKKIQGRIELLNRQQAEQWAKAQIENEADIVAAEIPANSLAVTYFKPNAVPERLVPIHVGLTDLLIVDLSLIEGLTVVERIKLKEIYNELALATTDLFDEKKTPVEMGKLLGANTLVTGTFTSLGEGPNPQWRVDPTLGMVKSGQVTTMEELTGEIASFIQVEKTLALQILDTLEVQLTPEERARIAEKIKQNIPTESLEAFLAYSRGLDDSDSGRYTEAAQEFETAISIDPKFNQAKAQLNTTNLLSAASSTSTDDLEKEWVATANDQASTNEVLTTTVGAVSQMAIGDTTGKSPRPEPEVPEAVQPPAVEVEVEIRW